MQATIASSIVETASEAATASVGVTSKKPLQDASPITIAAIATNIFNCFIVSKYLEFLESQVNTEGNGSQCRRVEIDPAIELYLRIDVKT